MITITGKLLNKKYLSISDILHRYLPGIINATIGYILLNINKEKDGSIIVFSHTLGGNSTAFIEWVQENTNNEIVFVTDDPDQYKLLNECNYPFKILSIQNFKHIRTMLKASVILTTHGPIYLEKWLGHKYRPIFVELWHGVGFKGSLSLLSEHLNTYDKIFVSSDEFKSIYGRQGINLHKMVVTGYARTDRLRKLNEIDQFKLLENINKNIPTEINKIVLFAPTWNSKNSIDDKEMHELNKYAKNNKTLIIYRSHINSNRKVSNGTYVINLSQEEFPDTELLISMANIIITDWSSVYADSLALGKIVIFIDSTSNFKFNGLRKDDRAGEIAKNINDLIKALNYAIYNPAGYQRKHQNKYRLVRNKCWGETLDGNCCQRYYEEIDKIIKSKGCK